MLKQFSVRYFIEIHELQTELGVFEAVGRQFWNTVYIHYTDMNSVIGECMISV